MCDGIFRVLHVNFCDTLHNLHEVLSSGTNLTSPIPPSLSSLPLSFSFSEKQIQDNKINSMHVSQWNYWCIRYQLIVYFALNSTFPTEWQWVGISCKSVMHIVPFFGHFLISTRRRLCRTLLLVRRCKKSEAKFFKLHVQVISSGYKYEVKSPPVAINNGASCSFLNMCEFSSPSKGESVMQ